MSRVIWMLCVSLSLASQVAQAASAPELDWTAWKQIPVLDEGRIKPLDTYADEKVTLIVGRSKWTDPETKRTYRAPELLFNWITKSEEWLGKPVIRCEFRPLRELLLGEENKEGTFIAVTDFINWKESQQKGKLTFHKPEVQEMFTAFERQDALERMQKRSNKPPAPSTETPAERKLREKAGELVNHTLVFLHVAEARELYVVPGLDPRTLTRQYDPDLKITPWVSLGALIRLDDWRFERDATIAALMATSPEELDQVMEMMRVYVRDNERNELAHLPQLHQAIPLQNRLQPKLQAIKPALDDCRAAYDGKEGKGPQEFERALRTFASRLKELAAALEDARQSMGPMDEQPGYKPLELDADQMALSSYPPDGSVNLEIYYNRLQPFYVSCWVFGLASLPLLLSWVLSSLRGFAGPARTAYLVGLIAAGGAILFATWGFVLRIVIAGRPPVTNMYETVIWVSYVVSVLGFWFGALPLIWPGLNWAWRLTAIPFTFEDTKLDIADERRMLADYRIPVGFLSAVIRAGGFLTIIWLLTQSASSFKITSLTPPISGTQTVSLNSLLTWLVGIGTVVSSAWILPRAALALVGSLVTIFPEARRDGWTKVWQHAFDRQLFLVCSIPVALFGMLLAYNVGNISPQILNPRIGSISAVLRNNYWLTIHVLTIVSSYGAGAMVWGLGNLAMLYYLFGRYRKVEIGGMISEKHRPATRSEAEPATNESPQTDNVFSRLRTAGRGLAPSQIRNTMAAGFRGAGDTVLDTSRVRPPQDVTTLANFGYKGMQVAVLLLAAGTILGGLWADVSWGRFWDWDPKEVWALISLLFYLVFLHGRYAGWVGTFGTNLGSVLCFQAIMMSWYGVNFVLPMVHGWLNGTNAPTSVGLHSYATGAGGLEWVAGACAANLGLALLAWARFTIETTMGRTSTPDATTTAPESPELIAQND